MSRFHYDEERGLILPRERRVEPIRGRMLNGAPQQALLAGAGSSGATNGYLSPFYPNILYSMRKRRSAYAGQCIRIRRSSDNTEQDIGFDANGWCDAAAITSFVGANDGFVKTWYDQAGNARDATQATAANQPQIVTAGVLSTDGGFPAMNFTGTKALVAATSADAGFGTSPWTIEAYIHSYTVLTPDRVVLDLRATITGQDGVLAIGNSGSGSPQQPYYYNGTTATGANVLSNGNIQLLSAGCVGGSSQPIYFSIGGVVSSNGLLTVNFGATRPVTVGGYFNLTANGSWAERLVEVLITKGTNRYTANFTPRSYTANS